MINLCVVDVGSSRLSPSIDIQVAFGVDLKVMASEVTESQSNALSELMSHLKNTLEGIEYSFYYLFFQVGEQTGSDHLCILYSFIYTGAYPGFGRGNFQSKCMTYKSRPLVAHAA